MEYYKAMSSIIENATDVSKSDPVVSEFREVAELIKTRSDMPKEAVRNFMARIQKKTRQIVLLTLELIEYCTCTCEMNFHTALNNKEFLMKISALLSSQNTEPDVKDKVLQVLAVFNSNFKRDIHPTYFQFQDRVKQKGFYIPEDYVSKYRGQTAGVGSSSNYQSFKPQAGSGFNSGGGGGFSQPKPTFQSKSKDPGQVAPKYQSAKNDLMKLKDKIQQANRMIDEHNASVPVSQNQQLCHFMDVLSKKDTLLQNLIGQCIDDEAMAQFALPLNDDLNSTIERFDLLKSGVKVDNAKGQDVEPEILKQIEEMELREKQEKQKQNQQPAGFSAFDDFSVPKNQPPKQQQQAPPPPAQNSNLLDLIDDAPPATQQQPVQNQPPQQQNNNQGGGDLFDMMDQPPPQQQNQPPQQNQFQPPQQQFNQPPQQQQFNQPPQQQQFQQQPPQQDKYAAFNAPPQQQQFNPMMSQNQSNPFGGMGMGGGMNQPPQQNNGFMPPPQNNFAPPPQNNGFMPPPQNNFVPPPQNNSFVPPPPQNQQFLPQGYKGPSGSSQQQGQDKGAFNDLDDMFGLGGGSKPAQNQPPQQQQFNQPPQQQQANNNQGGGFDLF